MLTGKKYKDIITPPGQSCPSEESFEINDKEISGAVIPVKCEIVNR